MSNIDPKTFVPARHYAASAIREVADLTSMSEAVLVLMIDTAQSPPKCVSAKIVLSGCYDRPHPSTTLRAIEVARATGPLSIDAEANVLAMAEPWIWPLLDNSNPTDHTHVDRVVHPSLVDTVDALAETLAYDDEAQQIDSAKINDLRRLLMQFARAVKP